MQYSDLTDPNPAGTCEKNVGNGFITYPCRLPKGHPSDEPCLAPENTQSMILHRRWEVRQETTRRVAQMADENRATLQERQATEARQSAGLVSVDADQEAVELLSEEDTVTVPRREVEALVEALQKWLD